MPTLAEPWLRGPVSGVDPLLAPLFFTFKQAREDLAHFTASLTTDQIWLTPHGFGSVGFHLRHIAGSVDRLTTYLRKRQLDETQLAALAAEHHPGASREELLAVLDTTFHNAEKVLRGIDPATLAERREVGRKRLPSTVIGLLTHIAEHTQRHVGQAISAAKLAAVTSSGTR